MSRARLLLDLVIPPRSYRYGADHRCQRAELHLPRGRGPHPVVVLVHGGSWVAGYGKFVMRGLAGDLARHGFAVWNIEYRRIGGGQGGGWPATFLDVAAAMDRLEDLDARLDLERVTVVGHSAGGQLALWSAARPKLPPDAPGAGPRILPCGAVSLAGVAALASAYREAPGGAVGRLMGGSPEEFPERYSVGDPLEHVPLAMPVLLVHGSEDQIVSVRRSREYAAAARAAGGTVELVEIEGAAGAHRRHIDPDGASWRAARTWMERQQQRGG